MDIHLAEQYYNLGFNPTCISYMKTKYNVNETNPEKSPSHSWKRWQVGRPTIDEVQGLNWNISNGIGSVLGHSSKCIDIDNCSDFGFIQKFLKQLRLPKDYEWLVKTPKGYHIHIKSGPIEFASNDDLNDGVLAVLPNEENKYVFSQLELRWANHIVLPPTVINGKKYEFVNCDFPKNTPKYIDFFKVLFAVSFCCGIRSEHISQFATKNLIFNLGTGSQGPISAIVSAIRIPINDEIMKKSTNEIELLNTENIPKSQIIDNIELKTSDTGYYINNNFDYSPIFIDIETTGLIKDELDYDNYPRIIQIAYSFYNRQKQTREIESILIKPEGFIVPEEITEITGLSNVLLQKSGLSIKEALLKLNKLLNNMQPVLIGHNLDFDLAILDSEYYRLINEENTDFAKEFYRQEHLSIRNHQAFCTMKKYHSIFGGKFPKLGEMYEYFFDEKPQIQLHDAENDVEILVDCYNIMRLYGYIRDDYKNQLIV